MRRRTGAWIAAGALTALGAGVVQPLTATAAALSLDMKVLVIGVAGDQKSPSAAAWTDELQREGVPFDFTTSVPATLTVGGDASHGAYNGIVIADDTRNFSGSENWQTLIGYETTFGVRQIDGYEYTRAVMDMGLTPTLAPGAASTDASLTAAGRAAFPYLKGPVGLDSGAWTEGLAGTGTSFTPLLTWKGQNLVGVWNDPTNKGRQELAITVDYNTWMLHWRLLSRGLVDWVTKGVHFGYSRNYLSMQVDDMFLADELWNTVYNCTPGETPADPNCPANAPATGRTARMTGKDLAGVVKWQNAHNHYSLTFAFNAFGATTKTGGGGDEGAADNTLTDTALKQKNNIRWVDHTWDHTFLGPTCQGVETWNTVTKQYDCDVSWTYPDASVIASEILQNEAWATRNRLPAANYHALDLVTPEHSGLDNPYLAAGLTDSSLTTAISDVASDASRPDAATSGVPGSVATSPRYPNNIYYNVSTWAQEVDEYNAIYLPASLGGRCADTKTTTCRTAPATRRDIINSETGIMLNHILGNDPRVSFAHQTNLVGENGTGNSVLLSLLNNVWTVYDRYFQTNAPLVNHFLGDAAQQLALAAAWQGYLYGTAVPGRSSSAAEVTGTISGKTVTITNVRTSSSDIPVTVPALSTSTAQLAPYAGSLSAWQPVPAGGTLVITLSSTYV